MPFPAKNYRIVLASQSPRRQDLLAQLGLDFTVRTLPVDEVWPPHLKRAEVAEYLAELKSNAFAGQLDATELLICADTIVCLEDAILNKPKDAAEATFILQQLSGKTHEVITGVCLKTTQHTRIFHASTKVTFRELEASEIAHYITTYRPFDKAGAYGIQEWIGQVGIEKIDGDHFNVVGLPLSKLWSELQSFD